MNEQKRPLGAAFFACKAGLCGSRFAAQLLLAVMDGLVVVVDLEVQAIEAGLHLGDAPLHERALLLEQRFARFESRIALVVQRHVLDERLDGHAGGPHALRELHARAILLAVVADAACRAGDVRQQADAFVVAQRVGGQAVFLAHFGDLHGKLLTS